ncbi:MAG: Signal recognition particle 54 kDa protein [Euryarchaeota archaeon ADurb.Bin294]|nr:MAG: Signal recognition particle 54 kDa protein [Euryarchaeota archaeon ADurb.Bin294]
MFKALKEKLFSARKKLEHSIEETTPVQTDKPQDVSEAEQISHPQQAVETPAPVQEKKAAPKITDKIVSFVRDREFIISEKDVNDILDELEMGLLESDVAFSVTEAILARIKADLSGSKRKIGTSVDSIVRNALSDALLGVLGEGVDICAFIREHERPVKILFTGVNGTGKTTSIAKVTRFLQKNGFSVVLGAGDTFRAGAIEQIDVHGERLGVKVIQHQEGSDPTAVLFDTVEYARAHKIDVVLGDTAGRFHNRANLMNQLAKIRRVINPDLIVYVDEAVAGNDAVIRAEEFAKSVGMDAIMLTKVDMDPKGGAAISVAYAVGKPLLFIGTGQGYDDVMAFNPRLVVADLLGDA